MPPASANSSARALACAVAAVTALLGAAGVGAHPLDLPAAAGRFPLQDKLAWVLSLGDGISVRISSHGLDTELAPASAPDSNR